MQFFIFEAIWSSEDLLSVLLMLEWTIPYSSPLTYGFSKIVSVKRDSSLSSNMKYKLYKCKYIWFIYCSRTIKFITFGNLLSSVKAIGKLYLPLKSVVYLNSSLFGLNAPMESFHASLKKECVYPVPVFENYETAAAVLFEYVHAFYNRKRIHSSLGYQTPLQVEIATLTSQMAAWFNAFHGSNKLLITINDLFELWNVNAVLNVS